MAKQHFHNDLVSNIVAVNATTGASETIGSAATRVKIPEKDWAKWMDGFLDGDFMYAIFRGPVNRELIKISKTGSTLSAGLVIERNQDGNGSFEWPDGSTLFSPVYAPVAEAVTAAIQKTVTRTVTYNPNGVLTPDYAGEKVLQLGSGYAARCWKAMNDLQPTWKIIYGRRAPHEKVVDGIVESRIPTGLTIEDPTFHLNVQSYDGSPVTVWQPSTGYEIDDIVIASDSTGKFVFICTNNGTSHSSNEPLWKRTDGLNNNGDGTCDWTNVEISAHAGYPNGQEVSFQTTVLESSYEWVGATAYEVDDLVFSTTTDGTFVHICTVAGNSGGSEPSWSAVDYGLTTDNQCTWEAVDVSGLYFFSYTVDGSAPVDIASGAWQSSKRYEVDDVVAALTVDDGDPLFHICVNAGTSGTSEPAWNVVYTFDPFPIGCGWNSRDSKIYIGAFALPNGATTTVKAKAFGMDSLFWTASGVSEAEYTTSNTAATPVFDPVAGAYDNGQAVTITCETEGVTIYYTTDGSTPDETDTEYTIPVVLPEDAATTLKAIAAAGNGWDASAVASGEYSIGTVQSIWSDDFSGDLSKWSTTNLGNATHAIVGGELVFSHLGTSDYVYGNSLGGYHDGDFDWSVDLRGEMSQPSCLYQITLKSSESEDVFGSPAVNGPESTLARHTEPGGAHYVKFRDNVPSLNFSESAYITNQDTELRIVRSGNTISGQYRQSGGEWITLHSYTTPFVCSKSMEWLVRGGTSTEISLQMDDWAYSSGGPSP